MPQPLDASDLQRLGGDLRQEMSATASGLRGEISATAAGLREEMSAMGAGLRHEMRTMGEQIRTDLREEIQASSEQVRRELRQEIQASSELVRTELRQELQASVAVVLARIDASAAETRRYMGVVAEDLRSDIKAVAEGLGALDERVERFRGEVHENFGKVDRRLLHLEVRVIGRSDRA